MDNLQRLDCEAACTRLCNDFAFLVDSREYEKLAALFTESATFERRGDILRGRAAILSNMQSRPNDVITRHVCTNLRIDLQQDGTATGTCYLLLFHTAAASAAHASSTPPALTVAEYRDVYVAVGGVWRIQSRVAHLMS
jgi:hypothetical protein